MKAPRRLALALVLVVGVIASLLVATSSLQADVPEVLEFDTMVGVTGPYVGTANPIRGVNGGGLPWIITSGRGELSSTGHLEVKVRGLVLARMAPVPLERQGINPSPTFRAIVSCQSINAAGGPAITNVMTREFPATATGNANIEADLMLPHPCIAPIIFVTNSAGTSWFAATGN